MYTVHKRLLLCDHNMTAHVLDDKDAIVRPFEKSYLGKSNEGEKEFGAKP